VPAETAELRQVKVIRSAGSEAKVEISLSRNVTPEILKAHNPSRLIVVLPGTTVRNGPKKLSINANGVRAVRYALNQSSPPETHLVVDLQSDCPYTVANEGTTIVLTLQVSPPLESKRRNGPAPAASAPITSIFRKSQSAPVSTDKTNQADSSVAPPPTQPPLNFPSETAANQKQVAAQSTSAKPSARHPNYGSLAEGTVFPSMGTPGSGNVPQPVGGKSQSPETTANTIATHTTPNAAPSDVSSLPQKNGTPQAAPINAKADQQPQPSVGTIAIARPKQGNETDALAPQASEKPSPISSQPPSMAVATDDGVPAPAIANASPDITLSTPVLRKAFRVKYVTQDTAYLEGGRAAGLSEGMKLVVRESAAGDAIATPADNLGENGIAELEVISVAETSSVTNIVEPKRPVRVGDLAYLSAQDQEALVQRDALSATRKYPTVISFSEGDTLDDEAREEVPKPPLPSVNRARGRIGVDYMGMMTHDGSGSANSNLGLVVRTDITRLNGTYWNLSGYWRGRLNSRTSNSQPTLQDLINRTYHLSMTYDNPNSAWVAGFGRLYLPWANSLDTIDGGYFGRRIHEGTTLGIFAGSTPDPTSWSYNPDRRIGGAFINFEGGDYDGMHYTSTSGIGLSTLKWTLDRPFLFLENGFSYKHVLSIYQSLQADSPRGNPPEQPSPGPGIGRSFTTVRLQPHPRVEFSLNHTYFRDLPTFDPALIGTGLLDKYLFQGFSAGARVEVLKQIWLYTDLGRSNRTGDASTSLNQMYGITFGKLPWLGIRADARYSRFSSVLGQFSQSKCTEQVVQEKLTGQGKIEYRAQSTYDYLVILTNAGGELSLDESRLPVQETKAPKKNVSLLVSNGFATLFLVFHPYYSGAFRFTDLGQETIDGHLLQKIQFEHVRGLRTPAALALRGREYPLELTGTAWIDPQTGSLARITAGVEQGLDDIGMKWMRSDVNFVPITFKDSGTTIWFPEQAHVEVETPRQHWRNTHRFTDYKLFSVSTEEKVAQK
jgi:hypothetical protein